MEEKLSKVKIVEWQGRITPVYEELGEVDVFVTELGYNGDAKEYCIDIEDLVEWFKYRRSRQ